MRFKNYLRQLVKIRTTLPRQFLIKFFQFPASQICVLLRSDLDARLCKCTNIMKSISSFWLFFSELIGTLSGVSSSTLFIPLGNLFESFQITLALTAMLHVLGNSVRTVMYLKNSWRCPVRNADRHDCIWWRYIAFGANWLAKYWLKRIKKERFEKIVLYFVFLWDLFQSQQAF